MEDIEKTTSTEVGGVEKPVAPIAGADEALKFLRREEEHGTLVEIDEKKLLRKINWMVMPVSYTHHDFLRLLINIPVDVCLLHFAILGQDPHQLCECDGSKGRYRYHSISIFVPRSRVLRLLLRVWNSTRMFDAEVSDSQILRIAGHSLGVYQF